MDANTWVDPGVVGWLNEKAVALQLDVDTDAVAKEFDIRAMPTVVAIKNDRELDRIVGYRAPQQLLAWLDGLEQGKTELDAQRASAKGNDLSARFQLAQTLLMRGAIDEAAAEMLWLWNNALAIDPAWAGVRASFLLGLLEEAAGAAPNARAVIAAQRDASERGGDDWICLNKALGDEQATLAWFDEARAKGPLKGVNLYLEALLMEQGRWKDLGEVITNPLQRLQRNYDVISQVPPELAEEARNGVRAEAEALEKALRAAGRSAEADELVAEARRRDPSR